MRRRISPVLLFLAAACSSTSPTGTAPPPPPPAGTPASLTIVSGDGQSAAPGSIVSAKVSVLVKDASGTAVLGVAVHFAVDSGGGAISAATATTGANGIATAGDWKLGSDEGRNTLVAQAGTLSVRLSATAIYPTTELADQSVPPGGSLTVNQPTAALNGLRIDVPAGAFGAALALTVQSGSSLAIPHVPGVTIGSPLITIQSDAPAPAKSLLRIRIPATIGPDDVPLVAIVDPTTGFIDALPTVDFDANGVTASIWSLDGTQYAEGQSAGLRALRAGTTPRMQLAIFLISNNLLHTKTFDTGFLPGVDDWDFLPEATSTWDQNNVAGAAVTERYYFVNQKSKSSGPLFGRFDIANGVPSSNVSGYRWSATVAARFDTLVQPFITEAMQDRAANPVRYDVHAVQWIAASMFASNGRPQILAFDDPATRIYKTVLARAWDGPNGILRHANPMFPGDLTKGSNWTSNGYVCLPTCFVTVYGLNHLIRYAGELDAQWPFVLDNTISQGVGPVGNFESWSPLWIQTKYEIPDTLFMVNDTTRLWSECPACSHWLPSSLPTSHGSPGIQSELAFVLSSSGGTPLAAAFPGTPLDRSELSSTAWIDTQVGFEFRSLRDLATQFVPDTRWQGWRTFQVIKYALALQASSFHSGAPGVGFDLSTTGGPALSNALFYEFDWGDGTARGQFLGTHTGINHVYQADGHYTVEVFVKHPGLLDANGSMQVIGDVTLDIDLAGPSIQFVVAGTWDPTKTPPNGAYTFTDFAGARVPDGTNSGLDGLFLGYDLGTFQNSDTGVLLILYVTAGAPFTQGETFSKVAPNVNVAGGQCTLLLATDFHTPNSPQFVPAGTGSCTIDALAQLSDGSFVAHYTFTVTNAAGGTISGSGVGAWK